jgi:hypothetical protein
MRVFSRTTLLAVLAMLGIFLVFFYPASSGPFSVTNGPATAFRALAAARLLFAAIGAALLFALLRRRLQSVCLANVTGQIPSAASSLALRC